MAVRYLKISGVAALITSTAAFLPPSPIRPTTRLSAFKFEYTHTEVNGMLWKVPDADLSVVVDPIISQLDFGVPWGYRANKFLGEEETLNMIVEANPSYCLISQGLDDHCHLPTLTKLQQRLPDLNFIVAPSARDKLETIVTNKEKITALAAGNSLALPTTGNVECRLTAVEGSLVGPPWQARENGWLLTTNSVQDGVKSVFYEPHADIKDQTLNRFSADIVIAPVKKQSLPNFTLVYGLDRTLQIADRVNAKVLIPLGNGELKTEGPLAGLVKTSGSIEDCERKITNEKLRLERPTPGVPLTVTI